MIQAAITENKLQRINDKVLQTMSYTDKIHVRIDEGLVLPTSLHCDGKLTPSVGNQSWLPSHYHLSERS